MDSARFDRVTRVVGRRGILHALLGLAGLAAAAPPVTRVAAGPAALNFCHDSGTGGRCRTDRQCCSHDCKRKRHKRRGTCRCSAVGKPCGDDGDCCGHDPQDSGSPRCTAKFDDPTVAVCCRGILGPCKKNADCCGGPGHFCDTRPGEFVCAGN
jgi:hypothetical protein